MTTIKNRLTGEISRWQKFSMVLFLLCLLKPVVGYAASAVTVAVLPVDSIEVSRLRVLNDGVRGMLVSRLSAEAGMELLLAAFVDRVISEAENDWRSHDLTPFFALLDADYLLLPELRSGDSGWTLQVQLFNPFTAGHAVHTFESTGKAAGQMVAAMSRLTHDIAIFITDLEEKAVVADQTGQSTVAIKSEDLISFRTAHPERSNPEIVALAGTFKVDKPFYEAEYSLFLTAMESGDIDADGNDEIVLAGKSNLVIKSFQGNEMRQKAMFPLPDGLAVHGIGIADLNENGIAEIYVSGMKEDMPSSFVIEWTPRGFLLLASSVPWYLRVVMVPGQGLILAGQRFDGESADVIYRLDWQKKSLVVSEELSLPRKVNLFNFAFANLDGDGKNETIIITADGHLQVHDHQGKQLWRSESCFCGTYRTIAGKKSDDALKPLFSPEHEMLIVPSRIEVADFNNDGRNDVVVNKNPMTLSSVLEDGKSYPHGVVIGFFWNGERLLEAWRTKPFDGNVVEYQMRRIDDSAPLQLIVGIRRQAGMFAAGPDKSRLYLFEMDLDWL